MYKKIVVGYDGSDRALRAVEEATVLAKALGASLHLVTAVSKDEVHEFGASTDKQFLSDTQLAKASLTKLAKQYSDVEITTAAVVSGPAKALLNEAAATNADLIVVGNRNVQGLGRILGSIASDVSQAAECAVLISQTSEKFVEDRRS